MNDPCSGYRVYTVQGSGFLGFRDVFPLAWLRVSGGLDRFLKNASYNKGSIRAYYTRGFSNLKKSSNVVSLCVAKVLAAAGTRHPSLHRLERHEYEEFGLSEVAGGFVRKAMSANASPMLCNAIRLPRLTAQGLKLRTLWV